jgi:hypothetical protein
MTYGIAIAWCIAGLVDILHAVSIAAQAGLFSAVSNLRGLAWWSAPWLW